MFFFSLDSVVYDVKPKYQCYFSVSLQRKYLKVTLLTGGLQMAQD